jgi:hypothetical protein
MARAPKVHLRAVVKLNEVAYSVSVCERIAPALSTDESLRVTCYPCAAYIARVFGNREPQDRIFQQRLQED